MGATGRQREGFFILSAQNSLALKLCTCITLLKKGKVRAILELLNSCNQMGGSGVQSGGPVLSGSPVGRTAVSRVVVAAMRNEVKVRCWCGKVSMHRRSAWKDAGLSTARRERRTVSPMAYGGQVVSSSPIMGTLPSSIRISFLTMSMDFYCNRKRA